MDARSRNPVLLAGPALYAILKRIGPVSFLALGVGVTGLSPGAEWGIPVLPYLALFMAGMAASASDWRPSATSQKLSAGVALVIIGIVVIGGYAQMIFDPGDAPATSRLNWLLAIVLAPAALATVWRGGGDARDSMLGDMSYIVYLLHWPVLVWTSALAASIAPWAGIPLFCSLLAAVSLIVWRYVDRPLNDLRASAVSRWAHRGAGLEGVPAHARHPT